MIERATYKDRSAYRVHGKDLTAVFLPADGGKMASLTDGSREFLAQAAGDTYRRLLPDGDYVSSECSGFDDMFPTIDPYTPDCGRYMGKTYPDHGEVCRHPMEVDITADALKFAFTSKLFPVHFSKQITGNSGGIAIDYTIQNHGAEAFPYIWAAHCMLRAEPDARIVLPFAYDAPIQTMFGRQLAADRTLPYSPDGDSYKFYFTEPIPEGWCGYRYADGKTLMLHFPKRIVKYLGIWINNGSFKSMYNLALEPCTAPYDRPDAAMARCCGSLLAPGERLQFRLRLTVEHGKGG